jgi:hypothetical protein
MKEMHRNVGSSKAICLREILSALQFRLGKIKASIHSLNLNAHTNHKCIRIHVHVPPRYFCKLVLQVVLFFLTSSARCF